MTELSEAVRQRWLSMLISSMSFVIRPADTPTVRAPGALPYRVLLLGGGIAIGLGVTRSEVALPAHIARHLSSITGRGVEMDVCARLGMTVAAARGEAGDRDLAGYDAVVLMLGMADALSALSPAAWRSGSEALLAALLHTTPPTTRIVAVGAHVSWWSPFVNPALAQGAARRVDEYNAVSRELCWSLPRTSYLLMPVGQPGERSRYSIGDYNRSGRVVAAHLAHRLARQPPFGSGEGSPDAGLTLRSLGLLGLAPDAVIDRVIDRGRSAFGVDGAALAMLRFTASPLTPLATATAEQGGLAVRDLRKDRRFQGGALALEHGVAFYAGYPVQGPDGECVAVLALFDDRPRSFSTKEMALLRDHALLIQEALAADEPGGRRPRRWRVRTAGPAPLIASTPRNRGTTEVPEAPTAPIGTGSPAAG